MSRDQETEEINKAKGVIYGLAIGDALGHPTEFMPLSRIKAVYGESGIMIFLKIPRSFHIYLGRSDLRSRKSKKHTGGEEKESD